MSDDDILDRLATGEGYPRPEEIFADKKWNLVQAMATFEPKSRITLEEAVGLLQELVEEEQGDQEAVELAEDKIERTEVQEFSTQSPTTPCPNCPTNNPTANKFRGECGGHL